jgi:hypothetical protein
MTSGLFVMVRKPGLEKDSPCTAGSGYAIQKKYSEGCSSYIDNVAPIATSSVPT